MESLRLLSVVVAVSAGHSRSEALLELDDVVGPIGHGRGGVVDVRKFGHRLHGGLVVGDRAPVRDPANGVTVYIHTMAHGEVVGLDGQNKVAGNLRS